MLRDLRRPLALALIGVTLSLQPLAAGAAEQVVFVSGAFRRSIPVADLEKLANTGVAVGLLGDVLRLGKQKPQDVANLLNRKVSLPLVLTSRLLNTRIGERALARVALILYPLNAPKFGVQALRSATILGLSAGDGQLSPVGFLRAYPSPNLAVNLPALKEAAKQITGMADVVKVFLETDLGGKSTPAPSAN